MKIQRGKYYINSDSLGNVWITEIKVNEKTGKEYEKRVSGYYQDVKSALTDMLKRRVYGSDTVSLEETVAVINDTLNDAINIIKNM